MPKKKIDHSARAHALLSASSSHRWLKCPYSATVATKYPPQDTVYTREGTAAHEVAELTVRGAWKEGAVENATTEMVGHAEAYRDYINSITTDYSAVMLEQRVDFSEYVPDGFGTADCIILSGSTMDVIDYKYGAGVAVSAFENPQMMLYGLGAVHEYGFIYDVDTVRLHIFQPRKDNISVYETTMEQLLAWGEVVVRPAAEKAASGLVEMHGGEHCRFCPHAPRCTELARYCMASVETHAGVTPDTLQPDEIAHILEVAPVFSAWLEKVKDYALNDVLSGNKIPGYKAVEGRVGNRKWSNELDVAAALEAAGVAREDYTTLKLLSPAEMDKALGKKRAAELLSGFISRAPGAPVLVPESDKRPAYSRHDDVVKDFE